MLKIKLLEQDALVPIRGFETDAGLDLYSLKDYELYPRNRMLIRTGISLEIPEGYYGRVAPRSGLAVKHGIDVFAGVIDSSYRGELMVLLYNSNEIETFIIKKGDRVAQLIIEKHYNFPIEIVDSLSDTSRGSGGFGSTGK